MIPMRPKCRPCRLPLFLKPLYPSSAVSSAVKKSWNPTWDSGRSSSHVCCSISFRPGCRGVGNIAFSLKQQCCPRCGLLEFLNRHSILYGNDPATHDGQKIRGQRVFCCNRGLRRGCGATFSIFLADVLPRHTFTATLLWKLLCQMLRADSIRAAADAAAPSFRMETVYHLLGRLRQRLDAVRSRLCLRQAAPASLQLDPLLQTVEHLKAVFSSRSCSVTEFQLSFLQPFLG